MRMLYVAVTALILAAEANAADQATVASGRVVAAIDRPPIGCQKGYSPTVNNSAQLNASIQSSAQQNTLDFPGGVWGFTSTIIADRTSRAFCGNGIARVDGGDGFDSNNGTAAKLALFGGTTTFNGTSITASGASGSAVLQLIGTNATANDLYQTVEITGGTNFIPGWYHVTAVAPPSQLTLDRPCATGPARGLTGYRKLTLWRDKGYGNVYSGVNFLGTATYTGTETPNARAAVLMQIMPNLAGSDTNSSKAVIQQCSFGNADVGILCGKGLAKYSEVGAEFDGQDTLHADHVTLRDVHFQGVKTAYLVRNHQSIHHKLDGIHCHTDVEEIIRVDRGGMLWARDVWATSGSQVVGPTLLRIGGASGIGSPNTVSSPLSIDGFELDAPSTTFKLLVMDGLGDTNGEVVLANGHIQPPLGGSKERSYYDVETPVATVKDGWFLTLRNVKPLLPGWVKLDNSDRGNFRPGVIVENCLLIGPKGHEDDVLDNPNLVIHRDSTAGLEVCFIGNVSTGWKNNRRFCRNGVWRIGTGWITGENASGFSNARPIERDRTPLDVDATQLYAALGLLPPNDLGIAPSMTKPIRATHPLVGSGTSVSRPTDF